MTLFTWMPIHEETSQRILAHRGRQDELLVLLRDMQEQGLKVISLQDQDVDRHDIPLAEIDPFTFLATFNRGVTIDNRRENWSFLKKRWNLASPVPDDFAGIPILHNMSSWLFPYSRERTEEHVGLLWEIAVLAWSGGIASVKGELFDRCLALNKVAIGNLTIGLFWMKPKWFLAADTKTLAYVAAKGGIAIRPQDYKSYSEWLQEVTAKLGDNYPEISHAAHVLAMETRSQGTLPSRDALTTSAMETLWARFHKVIHGFENFQKPGTEFVEQETAYKRKALNRFQKEIGREKLTTLVASGKGQEAVKDVSRALNTNLVSYHAWNSMFGTTDDSACEVLREFLRATAAPYRGPQDTRAIFEACARHSLAANWDLLSVTLWALNPTDFFPIKISYYRQLGEELKIILPSGRPDEIKLEAVLAFGRAFWSALAPQKPADWVDVQSFIWCVCPGTPYQQTEASVVKETLTGSRAAIPQSAPVTTSSSKAPAYWWLNANPKIWDFDDTPVGSRQTYTSHNEKGNKRQKYKYFQEVEPGDLVIGYVTSPQKEVVAICRITSALREHEGREEFEFEKIEQLAKPISYETLQAIPDLKNSEPIISNQGSLFRLREQEYEILRSLIDETNTQSKTEPEVYDASKAMVELFLPRSQFDEALEALTEKKNLVLQGAPGVGKTYVAKRLAYALIGSNALEQIQMIQFHQSYSYEDFIQGFRPTANGHFDLRYGIFYRFCRMAQREPDKRFVFIIDEINRGNLSKILGELMMLIEADKRGKENAIPLAYSTDVDERFYIPENVYLIGTMNTADRSLAMVDYALRRRFRFIALRPEYASERFTTFLTQRGVSLELIHKIISRMGALNDMISADSKNLGRGYQIGHSYFCPSASVEANEKWYRRIVENEIVPLLEEYWFDSEAKVEEQKAELLA
jgi:MoxR-like ATPase